MREKRWTDISDKAFVALLTAWLLFNPSLAGGGLVRVAVYFVFVSAIVTASLDFIEKMILWVKRLNQEAS